MNAIIDAAQGSSMIDQFVNIKRNATKCIRELPNSVAKQMLASGSKICALINTIISDSNDVSKVPMR